MNVTRKKTKPFTPELSLIAPGIGLLLLLLSPVIAEAQTISISGTVRDAQNGAPLTGIPVYLIGTTSVGITSSEGQFTIQGVEAGQYVLMASHNAYGQERDTLEVSGDADLTRDFNLTRLAGVGILAEATGQGEGEEKKHGKTLTQISSSQLSELNTVCACFESATNTLDNALALRKKFISLEAYREDQAAVHEMNGLLDVWNLTQQHCLVKFGTQLFTDSGCNRPDEVSEKRSELSDLGINN